MFEGILEAIIKTYLGRFLDGVDWKHLHIGVWAGNLLIEKVKVKPEAIDLLELPITLLFSYVDTLHISIPWSKLSTQPVKLLIKNVMLILAPKKKESWKLMEIHNFLKKQEFIDNYIKRYLEEKLLKQKNQDHNAANQQVRKQGYISTLISKIIDNIQIKINNIHVRFENDIESNIFACGITLQELEAQTLDDKFQNPNFFDRNLNSHIPVHKKISLHNLGFYWNSNDDSMFGDRKEEEVLDVFSRLSESIEGNKFKTLDYIIKLNFELKMKVNIRSYSFTVPEYEVELDVDELNLHLKNSNMQDLIKVLEFFNEYQIALQAELERFKLTARAPNQTLVFQSSMDDKEREEKTKLHRREWLKYIFRRARLEILRLKFMNIYAKIYKYKQPKKVLRREDLYKYKSIVRRVDIDLLYRWARETVEMIEKENQEQSLNKKILYKVNTFFKQTITEVEKERFTSFLSKSDEKEFKQWLDNYINSGEQPESYVWLEFELRMKGGTIKLSKKVRKYDEAINWKWIGLNAYFKKRKNNMELQINVEEIAAQLITQYEHRKESILPIIKKSSRHDIANKNFMTVRFEKNPLYKSDVFSWVELEIESIDIIYYPMSMMRFFSYFTVKTSDEGMKNFALENVEKIQDISLASLEDLFKEYQKKVIIIKVSSPNLIIPHTQNNDFSSECWVIQLGDLTFNSQESKPEKEGIPMSSSVKLTSTPTGSGRRINEVKTEFMEKNLNKLYDRFKVKLTSFKMQYYSSIDMFFKTQREIKKTGILKNNPKEQRVDIFDVLEDFSVDLDVDILKTKGHFLEKDRVKVSGNIKQIKMNLDRERFNSLKDIGKLFSNPDKGVQELLQTDKQNLISAAYKLGGLEKRGNTFKTWSDYYVLFSGSCLYFYTYPKDIMYDSYIYLRDASIKEASKETAKPYTLKIETPHDEIFIACKNAESYKSWLEILRQKITDFKIHDEKYAAARKNQEMYQAKNEVNAKTLALKVNVEQISIQLKSEYSKEVCFSLNDLEIDYSKCILDLALKCKLGSFLIEDYIQKPTKGSIHILASSFPFLKTRTDSLHEDCDAITINFSQLEKHHPQFKDIDLDIDIFVKNLFINWKPESISWLLHFLIANPSELNLAKPLSMLEDNGQKSQERVDLNKTIESSLRGSKLQENPESSRDSQRLEDDFFHDIEPILLRIGVNLNEACLYLVKDQALTTKLSIRKGAIEISLKPEEIHVNVILKFLEAFEMTNYPDTIITYNHIQSKTSSALLTTYLSEKEINDKEINMLDLSITLYENDSKNIRNDIYTYIKIELSNIQLNYFQQPVMRLIDYINENILGILTFDYKVTGVVKGNQERIMKMIEKPKFTDMNIRLINPKLVIKALPIIREKIEANMTEILIENFHSKNTQRSKSDKLSFVWTDVMLIQLKNMSLAFFKDESGIPAHVWTPQFNFFINIDRCLFYPEYMEIYNQYDPKVDIIDKAMEIKCSIDDLVLRLTRNDYLQLMKIIFNNISFDDGCDKYFINNYEKLLSADASPLLFELYVQKLNVCFFEEIKNPNTITKGSGFHPSVEISLIDAKISYAKSANRKAVVKVMGKRANGSFYEYQFGPQEELRVFKRGFLFKLNQKKKNYLDSNRNKRYCRSYYFSKRSQKSRTSSQSISESIRGLCYDENDLNFKLVLEMESSGDKFMEIILLRTKLMLNMGVIYNLMSFTSMDETVQIVNPPNSGKPSPFLISIAMRNSFVCLQGSSEDQIIVIKGGIYVNYSRNNDDEIHVKYHDERREEGLSPAISEANSFSKEVERSPVMKASIFKGSEVRDFQPVSKNSNNIKSKKGENFEIQLMDVLTDSYEQKLDFAPNSSIKVDVINMQIFISSKREVISGVYRELAEFEKHLKKRFITQQCNLFYLSQSFTCLCKSELKYVNYMTFTLSQLKANLSYKDIILFYETILLQQDQMSKSKTMEGTVNEFADLNSSLNNSNPNPEEKEEDFSNIDEVQLAKAPDSDALNEKTKKFSFEKLEIVIINDVEGSYVPVFLFKTKVDPLTIESNTKMMITCLMNISLKYYNPNVGKMEPIVEKTSFLWNLASGEDSNPKFYMTFELNERHLDMKEDEMDVTLNAKAQYKGNKKKTEIHFTPLNINVSDQMIVVLYKTITFWQKELDNFKKDNNSEGSEVSLTPAPLDVSFSNPGRLMIKKFTSQYDKDYMEFINLYAIKNESGYCLRIMRDHPSSHVNMLPKNKNAKRMNLTGGDGGYELILPDGKQSDYHIELDEHNFEKTFYTSHKISIEFENNNKEKYYVTNVELSKVRTKKYKWQSAEVGTLKRIIKGIFAVDSKEEGKYKYFYCEVKLFQTRKILHITSPVIFHNRTQKKIQVIFGKELNKEITHLDIDPQTNQSIPVEYIFTPGTFSLRYFDTTHSDHASQNITKNLLSFMNILKSENGMKIEVEIAQLYFILRIEKEASGRTNICIDTPFVFVNCLPVPIHVQIEGQNSKKLIQNTINQKFHLLKPQEEYHEFEISIRSFIYVRLKLTGFELSEKILVHSPLQIDRDVSENFSLFDSLLSSQTSVASQLKTTIYIAKQEQKAGPCKVINFYAKSFIVNATDHKMVFYYFEDGKIVRVAGQQRTSSHHEDMGVSKVLLLDNQKNLILTLADSPHELSSELPLIALGNYTLEIKVPGKGNRNIFEMYEFGANVRLIRSVHKLYIYTKCIEIAPRFVLINKTPFELQVTQENCFLDPFVLGKEARTCYFWKDCRKEKNMIVRINHQLAYKNQESVWEWSGPIDISYNRTVNFIIRSNDNYKDKMIATSSKTYRKESNYVSMSSAGMDDFQRETKFIKADITKSSATLYITFTNLEKDKIAYFIHNKCRSFSINYRQYMGEEKKEQTNYRDDRASFKDTPGDRKKSIREQILQEGATPFAWAFPNNQPILELKFQSEGKDEKNKPQKFQKDLLINLDKINEKKTLTFAFWSKIITVRAVTQIKGCSRLLLITEEIKRLKREAPIKKIQSAFEKLVGSLDIRFGLSNSKLENKENSLLLLEDEMGSGLEKNSLLEYESMEIEENSLGIENNDRKKFEEGENNEDQLQEKEKMNKMIILVIKQIGISIIQLTRDKRNVEMNFICIQNFELAFIEHQDFKTIHMRIKNLNIDNNTDVQTICPINWTPSLKEEIAKHKNKYYFDICFKFESKSEEILNIKFLRCQIQPTTLKIDEEYIDNVLMFVKNLQGCFDDDPNMKNISISPIDRLFENSESNRNVHGKGAGLSVKKIKSPLNITKDFMNPYAEWAYAEIPATTKYLYFDELMIAPIDITISFNKKIRTASDTDTFFIFNMWTNALGTAITNIDEAPIRLIGFRSQHLFDTKNGLIEKIIDHYKQTLVTTLLKVIGSIDIIGNPVGLFKYISSGISDLIEKPMEGMVQGPLEVGIGIVIGTGSLLKNTFAGTCNSINKITGSMATGLTLLTLDESFMEKRRKFISKRPKHVIDGVAQGVISIFNGVGYGLSGVVLKPLEGAKNEGISGFFKGALKGVGGLLVKPVAGVFDATAKAAEGLKNTATHFDDKPNDTRMRFPRPFYEKEMFFSTYNMTHAEVIYHMQSYKSGKFTKNTFFDSFIIENPRDNGMKYLLVLMLEAIVMFGKKNKRLEWEVDPKKILNINQKVEEVGTKIVDIFIVVEEPMKETSETTTKIVFSFDLTANPENIHIYDKIRRLKEIAFEEDAQIRKEELSHKIPFPELLNWK